MPSSKYEAKFNDGYTSWSEQVNKLLLEGKNLLNQQEELLKDLSNQYKESLKDAKDNLTEIKEIEETATQEKDKLLKVSEDLENTIDDVKKIHDDIKDSHNTITRVYEQIVELNTYVFGEEKDVLSPVAQVEFTALPDEDRVQKDGKYYKKIRQKVTGKKEQIETFFKSISDLKKKEEQKIEERDKKIDEEIGKLYARIENLLPGATAAGLTTAYEEAKKSTQISIYIWQACFIVSLIFILAIISLLLYNGVISFSGDLSFEKTIVQILKLFGCEFPCIWFAWASNIKIAQYTRLLEEYRHKWAMTRTFDGMQKAIAQAENISAEHRDNFYRSMLEAFADNPSKIFDKKYDPDGPFSLVQKPLDCMMQASSKRKKKEEAEQN